MLALQHMFSKIGQICKNKIIKSIGDLDEISRKKNQENKKECEPSNCLIQSAVKVKESKSF